MQLRAASSATVGTTVLIHDSILKWAPSGPHWMSTGSITSGSATISSALNGSTGSLLGPRDLAVWGCDEMLER